jgi:predicted short-subunit dehydrogenase-like oxidoreductase (DUF2520 family)
LTKDSRPRESPGSSAFRRIGFVGAGAVGTTLARALAECGARIEAVAAGHLASARALVEMLPAGDGVKALLPDAVVQSCDLVFLAVPDDSIPHLAESLPWHDGQGVVHLSGAKSSAVLAAGRERGARIAALHPLMTFPHRELGPTARVLLERLAGCYWALETEDSLLEQELRRLVSMLQGHVLTLGGESRIPYHIGAVFASNYVVALIGAACALFETLGIEREESLAALLPLVHATIASVTESGIPQALSGPVARGDSGTVASHLDWLEKYLHATPASDSPEVTAAHGTLLPALVESSAGAYRALARIALLLAIQKQTITGEQIEAIRALL